MKNQAIDLTQWITVEETMQLLKVKSRTSVYRFSKKYRIKGCKPQGTRYFHYGDIMDVFENTSVTMGV